MSLLDQMAREIHGPIARARPLLGSNRSTTIATFMIAAGYYEVGMKQVVKMSSLWNKSQVGLPRELGSIDIIIDYGSHLSAHQLLTSCHLFAAVSDRGHSNILLAVQGWACALGWRAP